MNRPERPDPNDAFIDDNGKLHQERRRNVHLSERQIDQIATAAATKAVQKMISDGYRAVGRNVVEKGLYIVGVIALGLFSLGVGKGWIKL